MFLHLFHSSVLTPGYFIKRDPLVKKMFNQDEEKMICAVGNRETGFWQYKKAEIVLISFLTS